MEVLLLRGFLHMQGLARATPQEPARRVPQRHSREGRSKGHGDAEGPRGVQDGVGGILENR
jgi:hypothetical protein